MGVILVTSIKLSGKAVRTIKLPAIAVVPFLPTQKISCNQSKNKAAEVGLPGYVGEKRDYYETAYNSSPERHRYGDGENQNPQLWSHNCQDSPESKYRSRCAYRDRKHRCQNYIENATQYATNEIDEKEFPVSQKVTEIPAEEKQCNHVAHQMP